MSTRIDWATGKVDAAGAFIGGLSNQDRIVAVTKTSTGVYELTLENALGVGECCPTVTPWYPASTSTPPQALWAAGLKADEVTLVVNLFEIVAGVVTPADTAFCVVVDRLSP